MVDKIHISLAKLGGKLQKMTRYDKFRNMTSEEMAQAINDKTYGCMFQFGCPCDCGEFYIPESCVEEIKKWLETEVDE